MRTIAIKDVPLDLHEQLKREAAANFRSPGEEALARIQRSFEIDDRATAAFVDQLIAESLESGPEEDLTRDCFDAARQKARSAARFERNAK